MERMTSGLLMFAGLVNFVPVIGVLSAETLANAYGIGEPEGDLLILLRHRALLFGILGGIMIVSAFRRHLQPTAMAAGFVSMLGFIVLAWMEGQYGDKLQRIVWIDVVALVALIGSVFLRLRKAREDSS